eukprot:SAG31_NODE_3916_length_3753_cov_2.384131_3_plen_85_part_00
MQDRERVDQSLARSGRGRNQDIACKAVSVQRTRAGFNQACRISINVTDCKHADSSHHGVEEWLELPSAASERGFEFRDIHEQPC